MRVYKPLGVVIAILSLSACAEMPKPGGKPVAFQTYDHVQPVALGVSDIFYNSNYNPELRNGDISSRIVSQPQNAFLQYAQNRFKSDVFNGEGLKILTFTIQDASVTKRVIPQQNQLVRWTGLADEDEFTFHFVLDMALRQPAEAEKTVRLSLKRTLIIPQSRSIAERETIQREFVDQLINDLDSRIHMVFRNEFGIFQ